MSFNKTKLYSVLNNKCPHCHKGDFFATNNPYDLKRFDKMYQRCPECEQSFEMETGFYFGAMYVSYGLTVAFGIAMYLVLQVVFNIGLMWFFAALISSFIVLIPVFFRTSRLIWINFFVKYDPSWKNFISGANKHKPSISKY